MFRAKIAQLIAKQTDLEAAVIDSAIEVPPEPEMGDYAFPCFMLAKELKQAPQQIATNFAQTLNADFIERVEAKGPYLNFFIDKVFVAKKLFENELQHKDKKRKLVFEYPSPNTNKPLHLGHLRNMLLGESAARICQRAGYEVVRTNLNNNRGIHICKSMLAYKKYGNGQTPKNAGIKPDHFVGNWYVEYAKQVKKHPELEEEAQDMLRKWEAGDTEVRKLWEQMNSWAHEGFTETYNRLGITFDKEYYEHEFYEEAKEVVLEEYKKGTFTRDENENIIAKLPGNLGEKVVLRADGTAIYATQDIALTVLKQQDFNPDEQIILTGDEQNFYFKQLFAIFELLGYDHTSYHLSYGMISLPSGRMKSREGNVVDCDELLTEVEEMAAQAIKERSPDISEEELSIRSKAIGHAAIKFFMLKYEPKTSFAYDAKESISLEGETGPYIQYTYARICSLLKKAGKLSSNIDYSLLNTDEDQEVFRVLMSENEVQQEAASNYKPHLIARYLLNLAQATNAYYHKHQINSATEDMKATRIRLFMYIKDVLKRNCDLLAIDVLEEM